MTTDVLPRFCETQCRHFRQNLLTPKTTVPPTLYGMHLVTRCLHSDLLMAASIASSQISPVVLNHIVPCLASSGVVVPCYMVFAVVSHCMACLDVLQSSMCATCPNHLSHLSRSISSNFRSLSVHVPFNFVIYLSIKTPAGVSRMRGEQSANSGSPGNGC